VVRSNSGEKQSAFGHVKNVATKLLEPHMMSPLSAIISIKTKDKTKAIFDSISTDNRFYPENPTKTKISMKKNTIQIEIQADEIAHLRANLNSTLRLVQASSDSIESLRL
jgi:KEOPS complex subunit Pcc1